MLMQSFLVYISAQEVRTGIPLETLSFLFGRYWPFIFYDLQLINPRHFGIWHLKYV